MMDSSGSQDKKPIPRFTSFKPPPVPPAEAEGRHRDSSKRDSHDQHGYRRNRHGRRPRSPERREYKERERSRDRRRARSEERRHSKKRQLSRERHSERSQNGHVYHGDHRATVSQDNTAEATSEANELFYVDWKGDRHNITYGTLHRYSVPQYRRTGRGGVIGVPQWYRIDRDFVDSDSLVLATNLASSDSSRTKFNKVLSKPLNLEKRLLRVRHDVNSDLSTDATKDFIPFKTISQQRHSDKTSDIDSDDERHAYRSILGKAKPEDGLPSDVEIVSEEDEGFRADPDEDIKARNVELNRAVENHPQDVSSWLRLIAHQDLLVLGPRFEEHRPLSYAERQSLADVKLSLYEKALKIVGKSPHRDHLLLGRLDEGAKLWDIKKLSMQWEAVLKANTEFISLWVKYLDFRQTKFLDFTYEQCMATFIECLKLNASSTAGPRKMQIQCYLFLRLTLFLREAGYMELAVGLWQAVLDFTCFRPSMFTVNDDVRGALSDFMEFWESEAARIGETGAMGWKSGKNPEVVPIKYAYQHKVNPRCLFASWTSTERERIACSRLPSRSLDESDEDDSYKVVLFSDLRELLSLFWNMDSADELIDSFLHFCHLPHLTVSENLQTTRLWSGDNFVRNDFVDNNHYGLHDWVPTAKESALTSLSPFSFPHHSFLHTTDTYFADPESWFCSFKSWSAITSDGASIINPDWVRLTLRALVEASPTDDELAEYALALEFACNSDAAKKYAKELLKKRSSNLRLYNSFALMQRRSGSHLIADHVWSTTLSMSKEFADRDRIDSGILWNSWIWELLQNRDIIRASCLLHAMPRNSVDLEALSNTSGPVPFTATSLLKIQNFLRESQERALSYRKPQVYAAYTDCLGILLYLANSTFEEAVGVYSSAVSRLAALPLEEESMKAFTAELLHQARARFIYYHIQRKARFKPSQIRTLFRESISLFPHNTMFLSLFVWNESRFRVHDRVRDVRDLISETNTDTQYALSDGFSLLPGAPQGVPISTHLFSIYTELSRPVFAGSTVHSIRATFERAIGDQPISDMLKPSNEGARHGSSADSARSNLSLWKLYILFELYEGDISRARNVFYRAMRACPWSKELIMLAFEHLRDDLPHLKPKRSHSSPGEQNNRDGMGFEDLRHLYNVLSEKGLRIHVDIENKIDEMLANKTIGDNGEHEHSSEAATRLPKDTGSGDGREQDYLSVG